MKEYQGFSISNFRSGFDEAVEPWLLPRDAYQILKNSHLYRGVLEKIPGYDLYARMSYTETITLTPAPNGVATVFTGTLNHAPSTTRITAQAATNAGATTIETFTYTSDHPTLNVLRLTGSGGVGSNGTVDLDTLLVTLNFAVPPAIVPGGFNAVIVTYDYLSTALTETEDIMGIKPYYFANGGQDILIFNTRRVGKIVTLTGLVAAAAGSDNGIEEIPHEEHTQAFAVVPAFNGVATVFTGSFGKPVVPGEVSIILYSNVPAVKTTITDNGSGLLTGVGIPTATGFINYGTGAWTITFSAAPLAADKLNTSSCVYGDVFTGDYTNFFSVANYQFKAFITNNIDAIRYYDGSCLKFLNTNLTNRPGDFNYDISKALHVAINRERLLLVAPTVFQIPQPNSIYWSVAFNPLDFTTANNAGHLDAPTSESIRLFFFINSDMIVRFSNSERVFRYTGDAFSPFRWDTTNNIWRCDARYSAINYDSYGTSVGKPAIVASDGVNVQRADEIIPDFTLNNRALLEGPIISIDQTSIGQCYGERFDDFKEGWLCFKQFDSNQSPIPQRSDNVLAFNYIDKTYAVFTFPFNCLGFGTVTSVDVWGNNFDLWGDAGYSWGSFWESKDALVDLAGDRNGVVYTLGNTNTRTLPDGTRAPVLFDVISKNFNPFIEAGELCRFGFLDIFVSANNTSKLRVQFFRDDTLYELPDGTPAGAYQETMLTFTTTDAMSPNTPQTKVWKRIYVGAVAREHTIRFFQAEEDFVDDMNQPIRIHAIVPWMKPAGRIFS
jgi:hypothetical protein